MTKEGNRTIFGRGMMEFVGELDFLPMGFIPSSWQTTEYTSRIAGYTPCGSFDMDRKIKNIWC